ncbi:hypothetical protein M6B38_261365 [Iris pallida]|uniref:Uncharacterized protein n=1 Tax=Iris pallida TaxID=29817 RepID=A0AAX6IC55_IRIPA|nr:hypothetical protein M6B38_261365 [Iris pallida]
MFLYVLVWPRCRPCPGRMVDLGMKLAWAKFQFEFLLSICL